MNRFFNTFMRAYMEEANPEGGAGGGGGADPVKTYTEAELAAAIAGLKAKNEELLTEKKAGDKKRQEAEEEKARLAQEALKQAGRFDEFEKTIRDQYDPVIAEKDKVIAARNDRILSSERKASVLQFADRLIDPSAIDIIGMMVKTEFEGDEVVTKFAGADGKVITTDPAQFLKYLGEHKAFSHLLKADAASGGGAGGGKGGGAATTFENMTEAERLALHRKDPAEFDRQLKLQRGKS